ncbi:NAD(P)(+) transhydrogenase (Re/Si-specific) subunit alpha, partial [bacterium]|nr:NAD(P)(+) transhydrogenase (Re/Si-specific) subunit alpha [bacterium]
MKLGIARETTAGENRVAMVPEVLAALAKLKIDVLVQQGAGAAALFTDADYQKAGAQIVPDAQALCAEAEVVVKVQKPTLAEADLLREGSVLVSFLYAATNPDLVQRLAARRVTAFGMEAVPRISRAQSMDALSSQANVAGYKAVLVAGAALPKFLPMMTTAAGTIRPAKVLVLGAGVAGLQAIATAKRLGAVVWGY